MRSLLILLFPLFFPGIGNAQDSLLLENLAANRFTFTAGSAGWSGEGWDTLIAQARKNQYVLLGEIHGIQEIPALIEALSSQVKFQTFVAEIDPYLARIITEKIARLSPTGLQQWRHQVSGKLSFYSYETDFQLLQSLVKRKVNVMGIDQITFLNDGPVLHWLVEKTTSHVRKRQYLAMAKTAQQMLTRFYQDQKNTSFLLSSQFIGAVDSLQQQPLPAIEKQVLKKLQYSRQVYLQREGHQRRIKLMKAQLMEAYKPLLFEKKVLFRFGANHSLKGESFLTIYDIGNLVHNLAESQFASSFHLAVVALAGEEGHPFPGHAKMKIEPYKELAAFYELALPTQWTYFNLKPLQKLVETGQVVLANDFLLRVIKGYDAVIVIPVASAAELFK